MLWSVNHSFRKWNENDFFTWVSLGIYLLWSIYNSFHKRNENDFSTWFSLGILLLSSVYHIFHKINQNWKKNWTPVAKVGLINILYSNICYCQGKALESGQFVWISTHESAQNGIISWEPALETPNSQEEDVKKKSIAIFGNKQWLLSIDMKTKVVQHVPRINLSHSNF